MPYCDAENNIHLWFTTLFQKPVFQSGGVFCQKIESAGKKKHEEIFILK